MGHTPWHHQLLGAAYVMSIEPFHGGPVADRPVYVGKRCYIYPVRDPVPFAYFCPHAERVPRGVSAADMLAADPVDPRKRVLLEDVPPEVVLPLDQSAKYVPGQADMDRPQPFSRYRRCSGGGDLGSQ